MTRGNTFDFIANVGFGEIKCIYLYFQNDNINTIYEKKCFEQVQFILNGRIILCVDYETLVYDSYLSNPNLSKGIYQVDWIKYHNKSIIPEDSFVVRIIGNNVLIPNISLNICADTKNHLVYMENSIIIK